MSLTLHNPEILPSLLCPFWFYSTFSQAHSLGLSWSPPDGKLHLQTSEWNKIWANLMWPFSPPDQHDNTVNGNTTVLESWLLLRRREFEKMWEQCYFKICMYTRYFIHLLVSILGKGIIITIIYLIWHYFSAPWIPKEGYPRAQYLYRR